MPLIIQDSTATAIPDLDLGPLYEPNPVAFTFDTLGWKILAALLLLAALAGLFFWIKRYIKNKYRREALKRITPTASVQEVLVVLKQVSLTTYGRAKTAELYGPDWFTFLDKTSKHVNFSPISEEILQAVYCGTNPKASTLKSFENNSIKWIKTHA